MRYCVIGAGAVGASVAAAMTKAGFTVDVIARGEKLNVMKLCGIQVVRGAENETVCPVHAFAEEAYQAQPDVIFVSVKGYSLESILPLLRRISGPKTVVIPLLNIYGTGGRLQKELPQSLVTDGCIYIAASMPSPAVVERQGAIFRIVFGVREKSEYRPILKQIETDLEKSGITPILSDHIRRDALKKYAYVSPMAAAGLYFDADAAVFQKPGEPRDIFVMLMREMDALSRAMNAAFDMDIVQTNLDILDALTPNASTSMQRDIRAGHKSEIDGLVFEPVRMGRQYGVPTPCYAKIAKHFGFEI